MKALIRTGTPFRIIVEAQQADDYAAAFGADRLLVLDPQYQRDYDACVDLEPGESRGSGPARNFAWDHAISEGHAWHWVIDDNIYYFLRLQQNQRLRVADGSCFWLMEEWASRWKNLAMCGPHYKMFRPSRSKWPAIRMNSRIYSCNLIRNDVPFRWRGRYNEDTDLSLRMLKAGWCTALFNTFLAEKMSTQLLPGGNMEEIYKAGTAAKSEMIVRLHPDVVRPVRKYGREHHYVDFRGFKQKLVLRDDVVIPDRPAVTFTLRDNPDGKENRSRKFGGPGRVNV